MPLKRTPRVVPTPDAALARAVTGRQAELRWSKLDACGREFVGRDSLRQTGPSVRVTVRLPAGQRCRNTRGDGVGPSGAVIIIPEQGIQSRVARERAYPAHRFAGIQCARYRGVAKAVRPCVTDVCGHGKPMQELAHAAGRQSYDALIGLPRRPPRIRKARPHAETSSMSSAARSARLAMAIVAG